MTPESFVTKETLTGSQINLLQMRMDKIVRFEDYMGIDDENVWKMEHEKYWLQYEDVKDLYQGFLFNNLIETIKHYKKIKK